MVDIVAISYAVSFILIQIFASSHASGEFIPYYGNETYHRSPWDLDFNGIPLNRSKRSLTLLMPSRLELRIKYGDYEVDLVWRKTKQYLANEFLRVSVPMTEANGNENIMDNVGPFVMYRDLAKCSAVVFFGKWNAFYGVIGTDYFIRGLPYDFDQMGKHRLSSIGEPYVGKNPTPPTHLDVDPALVPPSECLTRRDSAIPSNSRSGHEPGQSSKRQRIARNVDESQELDVKKNASNVSLVRRRRFRTYGNDFFSETLIFVTDDLIDHFRTTFEDRYITWIIKHIIIHFNAVDMMMAKLPHLSKSRMHMNIARIVIQDGTYPFDFANKDRLQFNDIVMKYRQHLYGNRGSYMPGSFDHVFIYTGQQIWQQSTVVFGSSQYGVDMYTARRNNQFYEAVPVTVVQFQGSYLDYPVAVHEIAQIFGIEVNLCAERSSGIGQCYSPMQRGGSKCDRCLKWSENERGQFREFITRNRNRCFFMNYPRSLSPPGPYHYVSPKRQCTCFGYDFYPKRDSSCPGRYVGNDSCGTPLRCATYQSKHVTFADTIPPFDGTSCAKGKVCWEGECVGSL